MNKTIQTLKGFRDFLPKEKRARDYVTKTLTKVFETYGFEPLETPTLEYAELLLGKYGEEADRLVYTFEDKGGRAVGLRYDQTVPTARVLSQYSNSLPRYFRRYQLQPVFRAEKPQKGRYREFLQCDIDIFGSTQPQADAEILACTYDCFVALQLSECKIRLNDRSVLFSLFEPYATSEISVFSIIQSVDKLDKLPVESVENELVEKGLTSKNATSILKSLEKANINESLQKIIQVAQSLGVPKNALEFTPHLARGLDYYTGMIFEVELNLEAYSVGSFAGGGRYDSLIKQLGGVHTPAVGMAFGFDRIVEALLSVNRIPNQISSKRVLVTVFEESLLSESAKVASELRKNGLVVELFASADSLGKQLKYADDCEFGYVVIIGPDEVKNGEVTIKNMKTGESVTSELSKITW